MQSDGEHSPSPDSEADEKNNAQTQSEKRKMQKEKSINIRFNYPLHYTHKDRKILRRIVRRFIGHFSLRKA